MKKYNLSKIICVILIPMMLTNCFCLFSRAEDAVLLTAENSLQTVMEQPVLEIDAQGCILMEASTGKVLYEYDADKAMPPASVTKVMTLLLVMEAIDEGRIKLDDMVTASSHACSMGGSQIYLKENEQMSVEDMLKSVVIASANDAACALAEHIAGSESAFVGMMNNKAQALGMNNTHFENTNGLDDTTENHVTSARDIAIMSRELISHKKILEYSSIWMDSVRNGQFGLTNTNRLVRFYRGCNGLKTGSTSKAGFCISVTAERDGMTLICVIMGAKTRDSRNASAVSVLDWGFANYALYSYEAGTTGDIPVKGGNVRTASGSFSDFSCVVPKKELSKISVTQNIPEYISAPMKSGDKIGEIAFDIDGESIGKTDITLSSDLPRINFGQMFRKLLTRFLLV